MTSISSLNLSFLPILYLVIVFLAGFLTTFLILPYLIKYMKKKGHVGYDIHKNSQPEIPESGGVSIVIGVCVASFFLMIFFPIFFNIILIFMLTTLLAGIIGLIDDWIKLSSRYKILLTIFTGSLIFLANLIGFIKITSPTLPFLGKTRLTIIYPLLVPVIVAIFANTTNMLEGYNGEGSGTILIAACFLFVCCLIWNSAEALIFTIIAIAVLIPFFMFNKYPAKVFPGDVGTLSMGIMIASIALFGSLEAVVFCVLLIHIFNSFYVLGSVRGFLESSEFQENNVDIILLSDDRIKASTKKNAALTLPRLILAKGPLTEKELVKNIYVISIICGFFAIITSLLMLWTVKNFALTIIFIIIVILLAPTFFLLYKFNRIRGIVVLMIILLVAGMFFLIIIDMFIMMLPFEDINLIVLIIPLNLVFTFILLVPGLILWYYITIKYFWMQINKMETNNNKN